MARLRQGRARVVGALLNAVSERSGYYYYRRHGYYRRYEDGTADEHREAPDPVRKRKRRLAG